MQLESKYLKLEKNFSQFYVLCKILKFQQTLFI